MTQDGATRERILDEFIRIVAESGVDRATYRDVAEAAGVSLGAVQHYFPEKSQLIHEAWTHSRVRFAELAQLPPPSPTQDPLGRLHTRTMIGLPVTAADITRYRFYVQYLAHAAQQESIRALHAEHWNELTAALERTIHEASGGVFSHDEVEDLADTVIAFKLGLGLKAVLLPERYTSERVSRMAERVVQTLLERPIRNHRQPSKRAAGRPRGAAPS